MEAGAHWQGTGVVGLGGFLLITHDRECLALAGQIWELSSRGLEKHRLHWEEYELQRGQTHARLQQQLSTAQREQKQAATLAQKKHEQSSRKSRHVAHKAARGGQAPILLGNLKRGAQVAAGKKAVGAEVLRLQMQEAAEQAFASLRVDPQMYADLLGAPLPAQKLVAQAVDFNVQIAGRWVFQHDQSFNWRGPVRIALSGANGAGKSTLLHALQGADLKVRGALRRGQLPTLWVDQYGSRLNRDLSVLENVRQTSALSESELRSGLARFLLSGEQVHQPVAQLSGGERFRAALAQGFLSQSRPELLILDEPTNNLDLPNVRFLEGVVRAFPGAVLIVSHDRVFIENCELHESWQL